MRAAFPTLAFLLLLVCAMGSRTAFAQAPARGAAKASEETPCPPLTIDNFSSICLCVKERQVASSESHLSYKYQERLYKAACIPFPEASRDPKDTPAEATARAKRVAEAAKTANAKIKKMWDANKESFACKGFNNVSVPEGNLLKFSIDNGFPEFLTFSVIEYQLDVNFKDPVDGRTIMDFLYWRLKDYKYSGNKGKIADYEDAIAVLKEYGAKTSAELDRK